MTDTAFHSADLPRVGSYLVKRLIGHGGQGDVYEAYSPEGQRVAIKLWRSDDGLGQMDREIAAIREVPAFCTARLIEAVLDGPRPYLVSEYVDGPNLRKWVIEQPLGEADVARLAVGLATALAAIHGVGVIHRDLKPDNVLIGHDGPRVIDFGIARTADMPVTTMSGVKGTPAYMAPEVISGGRAGPAADVFAWGVVVLFAASGTDPFLAVTAPATMRNVLAGGPNLAALPASLRKLVAAALARDPLQRPSAEALLLAMLSGDEHLGIARLMVEGSRRATAMAVPATRDPDLNAQAEELFARLAVDEQALVPGLFLRLVAVAESGDLQPRRAGWAELPEDVGSVMEAFRILIGADDRQVWLSQPALLYAWGRLRGWVRANRKGLPQVRNLWEAAARWESAGRKAGDLLQENRLAEARHWAEHDRRDIMLNSLESGFLGACVSAERRRQRWRRALNGILATLLVVASIAAGIAAYQWRVADARNTTIGEQRDHAEALRVAALADSLRVTEPERAMLLSLAAWRLNPVPVTRAALTAALVQPQIAAFQDPATASDTIRRITPDGRTLVSVGDGSARVYDVRNGRRVGGIDDLGMGGERLIDVAVSPLGRRLVVVTNHSVRFYDLAARREVRRFTLSFEASRSDDFAVVEPLFGSLERYALIRMYTSEIWDLDTGIRIPMPRGDASLAGGMGVVGLAGQKAVELEGNGVVDFWPLPHGRPVLRTRLCDPCDDPTVDMSLDGRLIAAKTSTDLTIINARTSEVISRVLDGWNAGDVTFSADGKLLASTSATTLQVVRIADGKILVTASIATGTTGVAFDPHEPILRYVADDRVVTLDLTGLPITPRKDMAAVTLAPGGRLVAVQQPGSPVMALRDPWTGRLASGQRNVGVMDDLGFGGAAVFSPDGRLFAVTRGNGTKIAIFNVATWAPIAVITPASSPPRLGWSAAPANLAFSHDGSKLAFTLVRNDGDRGDELTQVWQWRAARLLWSKDIGTVSELAFAPDDQMLAVAGGENRLRDTATGAPRGRPYGGSAEGRFLSNAFYAPDGNLVTFDADGRLARWDPITQQRLGPALETGISARVVGTLLTMSPDNIAAVASTDGQITLFDMVAGIRLGTLAGVEGEGVAGLIFAEDGATLISVDKAGHARRQNINPDVMAAALCARIGRGMTPAEWRADLGDVPYRELRCVPR
ncbi:protein kinase [Streptosporangiaceae bacterium NEAU-GS5]|nr:protein kinase [Streptosporangiaceae bacterium NEAU-GS5]